MLKIGSNCGCSYQAVLNIIKKYKSFKSVEDRPKKTDDRQIR